MSDGVPGPHPTRDSRWRTPQDPSPLGQGSLWRSCPMVGSGPESAVPDHEQRRADRPNSTLKAATRSTLKEARMGWESYPKRRGIDGVLRGKRRARRSFLGRSRSPDDGRERRPSVCRDRRHGAPGKSFTAQFHHDLRSLPPRCGRPHIQICDTRVRDVCRRCSRSRHRVRDCRLRAQVHSGPIRVEGAVHRIGHHVDDLRAPGQRANRPAGNAVGTGREHPLFSCQDRPSARLPCAHREPWRLPGVDVCPS